MRLYSLSKTHFVLVFVVFFFCFGVSTLIGVSGPKIISENYYNGLSLSINGSKSGPFDLRSPPLSTYNKQLWLTCIIQLDHSIADLSWEELGMNVELQGVMQDASVMRISNNIHNKNRSLRCAADDLKDKIKNVTFVFKMYNATFSQVEIWFRFVFVVMTFIVTLVSGNTRRFLPGSVPVCAAALLAVCVSRHPRAGTPCEGPSLVHYSPVCSAHLCCPLQGDRRFLTFYLPKLLIVGLLWLSAVTLGIWQTVNELQDPTYQYKVDIQNFQGMKVFFLLLVAVYVLYLVFLVLCACSELKNAPYTDLRLKFLTALTLLVLVISVVILYLRFGSKALQDNFVSELSTHYQNYILPHIRFFTRKSFFNRQNDGFPECLSPPAEFLSFYGLLNFYLYTLAFVYSPSRSALYGEFTPPPRVCTTPGLVT
ncbi:hypothetical protein cypCar_00045613 [Cyprinus carpio]|nr:hypothetical protein cypCar_00045613 [Cyprinus carpio]